jgi:peroxiredoxin
VRLKPETIERAKEMARAKNLDFHVLEDEWQEMIRRNGAPDSPDGAFIGFIKKKRSLAGERQGNLL